MNIDDFKNIIEPVINRNNCLLWGIEILRGKKRNTLRVFIDSNNNVKYPKKRGRKPKGGKVIQYNK